MAAKKRAKKPKPRAYKPNPREKKTNTREKTLNQRASLSSRDVPFVSYPQRPLTPSEALRIGGAMLPYGLPFGADFASSEIWIVMETGIPHRMIGMRGSYAEATSLLGDRLLTDLPADVYGPFSPPPQEQRFLDDTSVCQHDDTSLERSLMSDGRDVRALGRNHSDMRSLTLTIEWEPRGGLETTATFHIEPHTDTIFLTRASREAFAYPRYLAMFGPDYVGRMRQDLQET